MSEPAEKEYDPSYKGSLPEGVEARAGYLLADMFSGSVLPALEKGRQYLYCWERETLEWLREWRERDPDTPICAWTSAYMRHGPPPWRGKD